MIEQQSLETLEGSKARVTFRIEAEHTKSEYQKILNKYKKTLEIKGFRKGKVPTALIEQKFGEQLRSETFQEFLTHCFKENLANIEPAPLPYKEPHLCDADGNKLETEAIQKLIGSFLPNQSLEFSLSYDISPEIPWTKDISEPGTELEGLQFETLELKIAEEDISAKLQKLREENSLMVERKDQAGQKGDIVSTQFFVLPEGKTEPESTDTLKRAIVRIGETDPFDFSEKIYDMQSGETIILKNHRFPEESDEDLRGQTADVWLSISNIRTRELPELDDDFAQDIDEKYESLEDLKEDTRKTLQQNAEQQIEQYTLLQIYDHWATRLNFCIPRSMAAYFIQSAMENMKQSLGGNEQQLLMYLAMQHGGQPEQGLAALEKQILLDIFIDLVRNSLLKQKSWEASDEDIQEQLELLAKAQNTTAEALKEKHHGEPFQNNLRQKAHSANLSKELITEARKKSNQIINVSIAELETRLEKLKNSTTETVYQKFSPFADEGGFLKVGQDKDK